MNDVHLGGVLLAVGMICGFCSSSPLGPINLWLVDAVINKWWIDIVYFIAGVVLVDLFFAGLALWGQITVVQQMEATKIIGLVGGFFLILLGCLTIYSIKKDQFFKNIKIKKVGPFARFFTGLLLCASNPAFLLFWLFVVNLLNEKLGELPPPLLSSTFLLGVLLGDLIWFTLLIILVKKGLDLARPTVISIIRYIIALAFLIFGLFTVQRNL